jgi:hypothetical protein
MSHLKLSLSISYARKHGLSIRKERTMTEIELTGSTLIIHVMGIHKILAFKSQLEIPLSHVVGAEIDPGTVQEWGNLFVGVRAPGTGLPGVIRAGTYYTSDGKVFWDVHDPHKAITIKLADETYSKLVVEVADPAATIAAIEQAVQTHART